MGFGWSLAFPILDISVSSRDISDQSLELSEIKPNFARFSSCMQSFGDVDRQKFVLKLLFLPRGTSRDCRGYFPQAPKLSTKIHCFLPIFGFFFVKNCCRTLSLMSCRPKLASIDHSKPYAKVWGSAAHRSRIRIYGLPQKLVLGAFSLILILCGSISNDYINRCDQQQ